MKNKYKLKRVILTGVTILLLNKNNVVNAQFVDMPENWSKVPLEHAIENKLLYGDDSGRINPNKPLTRAELVAIINRVLGLEDKADLKKIRDVSRYDWYYNDIAKAVEAGLIKPKGNRIHPQEYVSREEVFSIVNKVLKLEKTQDARLKYLDSNLVSRWAENDIIALTENDYISGYNGYINPKGKITRAEYAQVLYTLFQEIINESGGYDNVKYGNVIVNSPDVVLKDLKVYGDLIITEGARKREIVLDNVDVRNRLVIRGAKQVDFINKAYARESLISNKNSTMTINLDEGSLIEELTMESKSYIRGEGNVDKVRAKRGSDGSRIYTLEALLTVDENVEEVRDKKGLTIAGGSTEKINKRPPTEKELAYNELEALRKEALALENEDVNRILNLYERIDLKSDIKLIKKACEDIKEGIKEVGEKRKKHKVLQELIKEAKTYEDNRLTRIINDYINTTAEDSLAQINKGIEVITKEMERAKDSIKENNLNKAIEYLQELSYDLDRKVIIPEDKQDKENIILSYEEYIKKQFDREKINEDIFAVVEDLQIIEEDEKDDELKVGRVKFKLYVKYNKEDEFKLYLLDKKGKAKIIDIEYIIEESLDNKKD